MRLTAITIENFKGIRAPVRMDLKPITLLFGPNSAGKSTVVQALHYAHEIFERRNVDPGRTLMGGEAIELGGFDSLVHGQDRRRAIRIVFDLDIANSDLPVYQLPDVTNISDFDIDLSDRVKWARIGISIVWSELLARPILKRYTVSLNGVAFSEIVSSADQKLIDAMVNLEHPIFAVDEDSYLGRFLAEERQSHEAVDHDALREFLGHEAVDPETIDARAQLRFGVEEQVGALPGWGKPIGMPSGMYDHLNNPDRREWVESLSQLIVGPGELVRDLLRAFRYVGPLREVPPRSYEPARSPDEARWARGLAAWDVLFRSDDTFIEKVNDWLTRDDRLDTKYRVDVKRYRELEDSSPLMVALKNRHTIDEDDSIVEELKRLPVKLRLYIEDLRNGIEVLPQDVGVGISQLLPVIVAALHSRKGIVAIEQPELHIHPAWQVVLGDLFLSQIRDKNISFLIETHSEHLMLRLLRRVRETTENELPPGLTPATPDDIAVYFVEHGDNGTVLAPLRVDPTGDFIDRWPKGFFEERAKELF